MIDSNFIITEKDALTLFVPESPLTREEVVLSSLGQTRYEDWTQKQDLLHYYLLQKIQRVWQTHYNRDQFLSYGISTDRGFEWHHVPFKKDTYPWLSMGKLVFRVSTGGHDITDEQRKDKASSFKNNLSKTPLILNNDTHNHIKNNDPFCSADVLQKQTFFEGDNVRLLVDYAPISQGEIPMHFLIVPKLHKPVFQNLSAKEYLEAMHYAKLLVEAHPDLNAFVFHKNGPIAGQSVPHWHLHVILTTNKVEQLSTALFKKMILGTSPITEEELAENLQAAQSNLSSFLNQNSFQLEEN